MNLYTVVKVRFYEKKI